MNKNEIQAVTIRVLDKEYQVACPINERESLLDSARLLDEKMREIKRNSKMVGSDRIAVMAALNIAHDLLQCKSGLEDEPGGTKTKIRNMQAKIEAAITRGRQLELSS